MSRIYSIRMCIVLSMVFLVAELTLHVPTTFATDWRRPGSQREAVEGTRSGGGGADNTSTPSYDSEAERAERNARYDAIHKQAVEASQRGDYRAALQLYEQQQTVRDGPNVRDAIAQLKALIAWQEATTAADYRRALAMRPGIFSQENIRYVEELEAKEKYERERQERQAEDVKIAAKMREKIGRFAALLDTAPPKAGEVVTQGGTLDDGMGSHRAEALLEFGNPHDLEAQNEQARQGFDKAGLLKGSRPIAVVDDPASHDPRMVAATQELSKLQAEHEQLEADIDRLTKERNTAVDAVKMKALTVEIDQKSRVRQEKLIQISEKKDKKEKLRRTINTQVETQKGNSK